MLVILSMLSVIRHLFCGNNLNWLLNLNLNLSWFQCWKKLNLFCLTSLITLMLLMWKCMDPFLREWVHSCFKMMEFSFSSKEIGAPTLSILLELLPLGKLKPWFALWSFFFLRLLCSSINLPHCLAWNTVVMSGLVLLDGYYTFTTSVEPLSHYGNVTCLSNFCRYYFGRCSCRGSFCCSDRLHDFLSSFEDVIRMSTVPFLAQVYLNVLKSRINRNLLFVGSF